MLGRQEDVGKKDVSPGKPLGILLLVPNLSARLDSPFISAQLQSRETVDQPYFLWASGSCRANKGL